MKSAFYTTTLFVFCACWLGAQTPNLPHYPTDEERRAMESFRRSVNDDSKNLTPPPAAVRTMAEWEEVQALVITWVTYPPILTEIVRNAVNECKVFIVTSNPDQVEDTLTAAGVPLDNVEFIVEPFNSVWIRDYGPWTVYLNDVDSLGISDWVYNRPNRPQDDAIPSALADHLGVAFFEADNWIHTGGNHLEDGMGTAFSSDLVMEENSGKTELFIDSTASSFLGVNQYVKFRKLPYDGIHHLDMHMRLLDEETIVFAEYPEGVADGPQINANIEFLLRNYRTPFGNPYRIIRIPSPPDQNNAYPNTNGLYRTYTNAITINKTILVPTYEEQYDTTALRIYAENLPGYNVVGINCNAMIGAKGALHCITKLIGVNDPLWIAHARLRDTYVTTGSYQVAAAIKHRSGIGSATLFYRTDPNQAYSAVAMNSFDGIHWDGGIPAQPAGTEVQYYIEATALSGKVQHRPIVAPEGYFNFVVKGVQSAPVAKVLYRQGDFCVGLPITLRDISEGGITSRQWSFPGGTPANSSAIEPLVSFAAPGVYSASLTVSNSQGTDVKTFEITISEAHTPYLEAFENGAGPNWIVDNPEGDAALWIASAAGNCDGGSLMMDNRSYNTSYTRDYVRGRFNLTNQHKARLEFDVAYARYSTTRFDGLRVNIIDCDGLRKALYNKHNFELATVATAVTVPFTPSSCDQWRHESIDLSRYDNEEIVIEFENIGGNGNRLYIDNLELVTNAAPNVVLTDPLDGAIIEASTLPVIPLIASANDSDGSIAEVSFWVNGDSIGVDTEAPYELAFEPSTFGVFTIMARATDNDGAQSWSQAAMITVNETVGLNDISTAQKLTVFPNPARSILWLQLRDMAPGTTTIRLFDGLGRTVTATTLETSSKESLQRLDVSQYPAGLYWLAVDNQGERMMVKTVIGK